MTIQIFRCDWLPNEAILSALEYALFLQEKILRSR